MIFCLLRPHILISTKSEHTILKKERRQSMEENQKSLYELYMEVEAMQQQLIKQLEENAPSEKGIDSHEQ